ncbi:hypothetical protein GEMRC1_001069 [Eukaryota sp. GEM-RC1]
MKNLWVSRIGKVSVKNKTPFVKSIMRGQNVKPPVIIPAFSDEDLVEYVEDDTSSKTNVSVRYNGLQTNRLLDRKKRKNLGNLIKNHEIVQLESLQSNVITFFQV